MGVPLLRPSKFTAYAMSLVVLGAAVWAPTSVYGQAVIVGSSSFDASSSQAITGTWSFVDSKFTLLDDGDATKIAAFQLSGITTGTTRTYTLPNASSTLAILGAAQSFSGVQTFTGGATVNSANFLCLRTGDNYPCLQYNTTQTPDGLALLTDATSNALLVAQGGDEGFDFATPLQTNPAVVVHTSDQDATEYTAYTSVGTVSEADVVLTESSATSVIIMPLAAEEGIGGMFLYNIYATDGSTPQVRAGRVIFGATNDGGVETCTLGTPEEVDQTPTGTLTVTVTCVDGGTNAIALQLNAVSSLTQTTLRAHVQVHLQGKLSTGPVLQ